MHKLTCSCICMNIHVRVHNVSVCTCACVCNCAHSSVFSRDPCRKEENTLYLPLLPPSLSLLPDLLQCVCPSVCLGVCLCARVRV